MSGRWPLVRRTFLRARTLSPRCSSAQVRRHTAQIDRGAQFSRREQDVAGVARDKQHPGKVPARGVANFGESQYPEHNWPSNFYFTGEQFRGECRGSENRKVGDQ